MFDDPRLDRRAPTTLEHVEKYPGNALRQLRRTVTHVERRLTMPRRYVTWYNQLQEGACVGMGESILCSLNNRKLYDAFWLYREAQIRDEFTDTPPAAGTSLSAGFDVVRDTGHRRIYASVSKPPDIQEGIVAVNRWLTTVDEIRTALSDKMPVVLGINWYREFYEPQAVKGVRGRAEPWIASSTQWGPVAGGHCICVVGASDQRQAVLLQNSWGAEWGTYGQAWLPYKSLERLLGEAGEAALVTDR